MADEYEYQPLPDEESIRVLVLSPGEGDEPLSGVLKTIHLSNRRQTLRSVQRAQKRRKASTGTEVIRWTPEIPYEAISYVWGSDTKDHVILLSGKTHQITANLSDALHQCRLPDQSRALWADSICIDQDRLDEKNHQVYMMARIYASSQRTLICLGTYPENQSLAREALGVIYDANRMIQETFQSPNFAWELDSFPWPRPDDPLVNDSRWLSARLLTLNAWFSRGWVVQEAALGREGLVLWAGCEIELLNLLRVRLWYIRRSQVVIDQSHYINWEIPLLFLRTFFHEKEAEARTFYTAESQIEGIGILDTLQSAGTLGLGDPRDRIYAFMALPFVRNPMPSLRPNYRQSHLDLYQDFAVEYLQRTSDLNLLCYVTFNEVNGEARNGTVRSSWVPQWDQAAWWATVQVLRNAKNTFGRTSAESAGFTLLRGANGAASLHIQAIIFDSIRLVSPRFRSPMSVEDFISSWSLSLKQAGSATQGEPGSTENYLVFLGALTVGSWGGTSPEEWADTLKSYSRLLQNSAQSSLPLARAEMSPNLQLCHRVFTNFDHDTHLFLLEEGYHGLGSPGIQQDDVCAFVFGLRSPLILRKAPQAGTRHYRVIGPAFVVSKRLNRLGLPQGLSTLKAWDNWDQLCESEEWVDWGLEEEKIILL